MFQHTNFTQFNKIFELRKGAKRPQCNYNFMNKLEEDLILSFPTLTREKECGVQSKMVKYRTQNLKLMELGIKKQIY